MTYSQFMQQNPTVARVGNWLILCALALGVIYLATSIFTGCKNAAKIAQQHEQQVTATDENLSDVETGIEVAKQLNELATGSVVAAESHADSTGKGHLVAAQQTMKKQSEVLEATGQSADNSRTGFDKCAKSFGELLIVHQKLQGEWYVKVGLFIEKSFWWLLGIYVGAQVFGLVGGLLAPASLAFKLAKQVRLATPFSNPSSWAMNYINSRRGVASP